MVALSLQLELMFWGALALNLCTLLLFIARRRSPWLLVLPWLGIGGGAAWLIVCREYLARPEMSLSLAVQLDLLLLPVLMLFSLFAGVVRLIQQMKPAKPGAK